MKFLYTLVRLTISLTGAITAWFILIFGYDQSLGLSALYAFGVGAILFAALSLYAHYTFLKQHQLTRNEYVFIRKNLREAKGKIKRLRKTFFNVRSLRGFRQTLMINRLVNRIYSIVRREPKRFFLAERFFFYHLDSVVELMEKYSFLAAQSVRDREWQKSLKETSMMIEQLTKTIEDDLYTILSTDMEHLKYELDVAKYSMTTWTNPINERSTKNEGNQ